MSEFMFGVSRLKYTATEARALKRIAKENGAAWVSVSGAQFGGTQSWFAARNLGEPFDSNRAKAVADAIEAAGIRREDR